MLVPFHFKKQLPTLSEEDLGQFGPEIKDVKTPNIHQHLTLHILNFLNLGFLQLIPKTHQHQQTEHRVLKMIHDTDEASRFRVRKKAIKKNIQNPLTSATVGFNPRRMEDLGGEIPAEEAPERAVRSSIDVVLVAGGDFADRKRRWTIGEEGAVEDEGFVGNGTVDDEDGGASADGEGDDGAIFGDGVAEERFDLERGFAEPLEIGDDGD